jgi:branched-chain amino acid transport system ATP-binding protein
MIYALEVRDLRAGYGRFDVVRGIDVDVCAGEAVALLGPNGAGKTTAMHAIMGLVKQTTGSVRVAGRELMHLPAHQIARGHAAIVPQGRRLFLNQSVEDNLMLGALHLRREKARVAKLLQDAYELFPILYDFRRRSSSALSGGQQQMVAIGRMLMSEPDVLLLDEPSLGLAPLAVDDVAEALLKLRGQGRSLLLVEQRVDLALQVCDRFYVLAGGEIALQDRTDSVDVNERVLIDAYLG